MQSAYTSFMLRSSLIVLLAGAAAAFQCAPALPAKLSAGAQATRSTPALPRMTRVLLARSRYAFLGLTAAAGKEEKDHSRRNFAMGGAASLLVAGILRAATYLRHARVPGQTSTADPTRLCRRLCPR
jgi:hypothetical protein